MNTTQTVQKARKAAQRVHNGYDNWPHCLPQALMDGRTVAGTFLDLTDPTPLTVKKLMKMGGKRESKGYYRIGNMSIHTYGSKAKYWSWNLPGPPALFLALPPQTEGQLRQLLLRINNTRKVTK